VGQAAGEGETSRHQGVIGTWRAYRHAELLADSAQFLAMTGQTGRVAADAARRTTARQVDIMWLIGKRWRVALDAKCSHSLTSGRSDHVTTLISGTHAPAGSLHGGSIAL
jgi:hypothetical protein